jgi:signal transduction histidine kinase
VGRRFGLCVSEADRPAFDALLKTAFESTATAACEVAILKEGTSPLVVRIEAAAAEDGWECRAVVADITERRRAEDAMEIFRDELESRVQERTAELARTNDQLRILASELTLAEEHERRRLAVELHDGLDQNLSLAEMKLGELLKSAHATGLNRPLREIKQLIVQANRQARSLTFQLSPAVLYDIGLSAALEWLAEQMQLRHGIKMTLEDDDQVRFIRIEPRILLFRTVRELAINVVKHARASRAQVSIRLVGEDLRISIEDDGAGFDPATVGSEGSGLGLFGIRERLSPLGGRMEIDSARGRGTRVTLIVPAQRVIGEPP